MDELAVLCANAPASVMVDHAKLMNPFSLRSRITLISTKPVVDGADRALKFVVDLAMGPARSAEEMRRMMDDRNADVITEFARVSREELQGLRVA